MLNNGNNLRWKEERHIYVSIWVYKVEGKKKRSFSFEDAHETPSDLMLASTSFCQNAKSPPSKPPVVYKSPSSIYKIKTSRMPLGLQTFAFANDFLLQVRQSSRVTFRIKFSRPKATADIASL